MKAVENRISNKPTSNDAESVVIRFAGDSGDGMQLTGSQFTQTSALSGNDLATLPNFPAEIRAPAGSTFGVSSYQIQFGAQRIHTPGDQPDVLVAMNPAALKVNLEDLPQGGTIIINTGAFTKRNLDKAGYQSNPLEDASLKDYQCITLDMTRLTLNAVEGTGLSTSDAQRCKNFFALGLVYWMYSRDLGITEDWINRKFAKQPAVRDANLAALAAGHAYGETQELGAVMPRRSVAAAEMPAGDYRTLTGTEGLAFGLLTGLQKSGLSMLYSSYPITPASTLLHTLAGYALEEVSTFQAEDEIAAACAAIGASFAGELGITASSGPGVALKTEALGLAVACELPLIAINCQRGGPSTGLPTKTEQSDLWQAVHGRNGDTPLVVLAPATAGDCFYVAAEAVRLSVKYMTPVIVLTDGYLMNASEPWLIPNVADVPGFRVEHHKEADGFHPFIRNPETLARLWAKPGTPGLEHRIGGLERDYESGHISYDPANHQRMTDVRHRKIAGIADDVPEQDCALGQPGDDVAVVGWGSTYGSIHQAVDRLRAQGFRISHVHIRNISPFPSNLGELLGSFKRVLVPELNSGQLYQLLQAEYSIAAAPFNQVTGLPFKVNELEQAALNELEKIHVRDSRIA